MIKNCDIFGFYIIITLIHNNHDHSFINHFDLLISSVVVASWNFGSFNIMKVQRNDKRMKVKQYN